MEDVTRNLPMKKVRMRIRVSVSVNVRADGSGMRKDREGREGVELGGKLGPQECKK